MAENDFEQPLDFVFTSGNAGAVLQLKGLTPSRDAITDFLEDSVGQTP